MKRCRHRHVAYRFTGQLSCLDCRTWLSLGPSNDEPEAVRIEIEAAWIVDAFVHRNLTDADKFGRSVAAADLALEILGLDGAGQ